MTILRHTLLATTLAGLLASACASASAGADCTRVLARPAPVQVAAGFQFTEGPVWHPEGYYVFSDIPAATLYRLHADGRTAVHKKPSGSANGNLIDRAGLLWSAQHDRLLTRTRPDGQVDIMAASFGGKKLNSPNDLAEAPDGSVWFSDPPYGISGYGPARAEEEQPVRGLYRVRDGVVERMSGALRLPNGLAFSRDGRSLYAADSANGMVYRFNHGEGGVLSAMTPFAAVPPAPGKAPMADGVKVDRQGRVWVAGAGAIGVFAPTGELLCRVPIEGEFVTNLAFGGADGREVLVTATDKLFTLRAAVAVR